MSFRLVPKSVTLNDLERRVIGKHNVNAVQTRARSRLAAKTPQTVSSREESEQVSDSQHDLADSCRGRQPRRHRKPHIQVTAPKRGKPRL